MDLNWNVINVLVVKMFRFFAGCKDCNMKMSLQKTLHEIFDLAFPDIVPLPPARVVRVGIRGGANVDDAGGPAPSAAKLFKSEDLAHYLMLSGVLNAREVTLDRQTFKVSDPWRTKTWSLRYIMMWCALQILFGMQIICKTDRQIRHHRSYIYYGVMDFYTSLWFYALHCLNYRRNDATAFDPVRVKSDEETLAQTIRAHVDGNAANQVLEFEEFHFYYTSLLPAFIKRDGPRGATLEDSQLNLSTAVFGNAWGVVQTKAEVQQRMAEIYGGICVHWDLYVVNISRLIHGNFAIAVNMMSPIETAAHAFFFAPFQISQAREERKDLPATVAAFSEAMGRGTFWFHFKHITFNRLALECKLYEDFVRQVNTRQNREVPSIGAAVRLWQRWYRELDQAVRAL